MSLRQRSEYYHRWANELRSAAHAPLSSEDRRTLIYFAADLDELAEEAAITEERERRSDRS